MSENQVKTLHPFEASGLGLAPFRFGGVTENVFKLADGTTKAGGCCDYCSNGIRYEYWIESADKKRFKVGCECVRKLERKDNKLVAEVDRARLKLEREQREAKRAAASAERHRLYEIELQAQRDRNGGLTDREMETKERERQEQAKAAKFVVANQWLVDVLKKGDHPIGGFVDSMIRELERKSVSELSPKCQTILCDIYSKAHGRRNSKAYHAAEKVFQSHTEH